MLFTSSVDLEVSHSAQQMLLGGWIIIIAAYFIIVICATSVFNRLWTLVHEDKFIT